jgi:chromate transporter
VDVHEQLVRALMLIVHVGELALISFGGIVTVLPAIHQHLVENLHWISDRDFVNLFAIAQASPGPNVLVLTLIGYKVAGIPGAVAATLALTVPTSLVAFVAVRVWDRFREARWRKATQAGLLPVTVGFIASSGYIITRAADATITAYLISAVTLFLAAATKVNPLWMFALGAILGLFGLM